MHAIGDDVWTGIFDQKVNMIAGNNVVKYGKTEPLLGLENPAQIRPAIVRKPQKKIFVVTTMRDVPDVPRQEVTIRARRTGEPKGFLA